MDTAIFRAVKIHVRDIGALTEFYSAIAGYSGSKRLVTSSGLVEVVFTSRDGESGLILIQQAEASATTPANVTLVFTTPDLAALAQRVERAGGKIVTPLSVVSTNGRDTHLMFATDPEGNVIQAVRAG